MTTLQKLDIKIWRRFWVWSDSKIVIGNKISWEMANQSCLFVNNDANSFIDRYSALAKNTETHISVID